MRKSIFTIIVMILALAIVSLPVMADPFMLGGSVFSELRYTPENLWEGGSGAMLWANIENEQAKINLELIWGDEFDSDKLIPYAGNEKPELPFEINSVTLTAEGKLLNTNNSLAKVTLGDYGISYSDWIGTLTEEHWQFGDLEAGENHVRGISLEDLTYYPENASPIVLNAFYGFYQGDEVMYGANIDTEFDGFDTNLSTLRYVNQTINTNDEGNADYGDPVEWEHAFELAVDGDIQSDLSMDLLAIYWAQMLEGEEEVSSPFVKLELDWTDTPVGRVYFETFSSFDGAFAPRFRNHDNDKVQNYLDTMGSAVRTEIYFDSSIVDLVDLSVGNDLQSFVNSDLNLNKTWIRADKSFGQHEAAVKLAYKFPFDKDKAVHTYHEDYDIDLYAGLNSALTSENNFDLSSRLVTKYNDISESLAFDGSLAADITDGLFKGFNLFAGFQKDMINSDDNFKPYAGFNYETPSGLELMGRYSDGTEAFELDDFSGFDDYEEKNTTILSIKKTVAF